MADIVKPEWFELTTADPDAAAAFYAAVLGWRTATSPDPAHGGYRVAHAGATPVAGLMAPMMPGQPEGWGVYFESADVDADAARIADLGGEVHFGPADIPGVGRFLSAADAQGVDFALMRQDGAASGAFDASGDVPSGHACWIELATPDPDGAFAFYGALFGWSQAGAMPMGDMGDYAFIGDGGAAAIGAIMSSVTTNAAARWNWYAQVPDIDAAAAAVRGNGGAMLQDPAEIPGGRYAANATDPGGHLFGLVGPRIAQAAN